MKKKQKIRVEKTEKGVEVFIDPEVTKISKGDIPNEAEILHIPANSKLSCIERRALPKSILVPENYEASHITRYRNSFYLGSENNPYFLLLWARKAPIHKDCQIIYPHRRNHLFSQEKNFDPERKAVKLKSLLNVVRRNGKKIFSLENSESWKTKDGFLWDIHGNRIASLEDNVEIYSTYFHGGYWWQDEEFGPVAHPSLYGYRAWRTMATDWDGFALRTYVYIGDELIGRVDAMASAEMFNCVCNHAFFDPECG